MILMDDLLGDLFIKRSREHHQGRHLFSKPPAVRGRERNRKFRTCMEYSGHQANDISLYLSCCSIISYKLLPSSQTSSTLLRDACTKKTWWKPCWNTSAVMTWILASPRRSSSFRVTPIFKMDGNKCAALSGSSDNTVRQFWSKQGQQYSLKSSWLAWCSWMHWYC